MNWKLMLIVEFLTSPVKTVSVDVPKCRKEVFTIKIPIFMTQSIAHAYNHGLRLKIKIRKLPRETYNKKNQRNKNTPTIAIH